MERCDCDKHESLNLYLDGQLNKEEESKLLAHIENCRMCETELADLIYVKKMLSDIPEMELPAGYHEEFMAKLSADISLKHPKMISVDFRRMASSIAAVFLTFTLLSVVLTAISGVSLRKEPTTGSQMVAMTESGTGMIGIMSTDMTAGESNNVSPFYGGQNESNIDEQGHSELFVSELNALDISGEDGGILNDQTEAGIAGMKSLGNSKDDGQYSRRNYSINIDTTDIPQALSVINTIAGSTTFSSISENGQNKTIEFIKLVPSESIDYCLEALRGIGKVTIEMERRVMTDETVNNLKSITKAKRYESDRLLKILESSQNLETLSEVSAKLGNVVSDLDAYESQLRSYLLDSEMLEVNIFVQSTYDGVESDNSFSHRITDRLERSFILITRNMGNFLVLLALISFPAAILIAIAFMIYRFRIHTFKTHH